MASSLLKALSPIAALADGGVKSFLSNYSPAYNLIKGKDKDEKKRSYLNKAMGMGVAGKARGMKKGGKVKPMKKTANSRGCTRGDGIATRGKTRGKMR